jgi:hypothetical protein
MKTHILHAAIGILALAAAGAVRADHAEIQQTGTADTASIDQASNGGYFFGSVIQQGGSNNTASITQSAADSPSYATAYVTQSATTYSLGTVVQSANVDNASGFVTQATGNSLTGHITQNLLSGYSFSNIFQSGNSSQVYSTQNTVRDARLWLNQGNTTSTYVGYYFDGYNYVAVDPSMATPDTVNSFADAEQVGGGQGLTGYILQYGTNQQAFLHQEGSFNLGGILQTGSFDTAYVSQYGTSGQARISQYGNGHYASLTQSGAYNVASIIQH